MDQFWAAPVVARTLTLLTLIESAAVYGGFISGWRVVFFQNLIIKIWPELWRLFTPFLLTGPRIEFIFDLYFLYRYSSQLETGSPRFNVPGSFFTFILFVASIIMLTAGCYLNANTFIKPLIMTFVWTWCQDNKHQKVRLFFVNVPALWLPQSLLLLTFILGSWEMAVVESMGIVAAHLYDFLTRIYPTFGGGRNFIVTPGFIRRFFTAHTPWGEYRTYGTAYRPETQGQQSAGWTSSIQNQWSTRGPGRRLGGE